MFDGLDYITLYWLSGFAEPKYEIWDSKKVSLKRTPDSLSFSAYLAWPQEVADEALITIRRTKPVWYSAPTGFRRKSST